MNNDTDKKSELRMAIDILEDEFASIEEYTHGIGNIQDPNFKKILTARVEDEKRHAAQVLQWLNSKASVILER